MGKAKQDLVNFRRKKCLPTALQATDLMPIINKAWSQSFARIKDNQKAISERGWNPLNYNLMLNPEIRATMTKQEREEEGLPNSTIILPRNHGLNQERSDSTTETESSIPTSVNSNATQQSSTLNFSSGQSAATIESIIAATQLLERREQIKKEQDEGKKLAEKLKEAKRITTGMLYKTGDTIRLGPDIFTICKENEMKKDQEMRSKMKADEEAYLKVKAQADEIIASSESIHKLSNKQLSIVLKSLKRNGDPALPNKKKEMIELYEVWKLRPSRTFASSTVETPVESHNVATSNSDGVINISSV